MGYVFLFVALSLNAIANLLMKAGADRLAPIGDPGFFKSLLGNYPLLAGVALFALNVVFYLAALTRLNLSVAYPVMMAGGVLIVFCAALAYFHEPVTGTQFLGAVLLAAGIVLVTRGAAA